MNIVKTVPVTHSPANSLAVGKEFLRAAALGGLVSGTLDAADGVVAFGLYGMNPIEVLQFIASGAFGPSAFDGGFRMAGAGAAFHFVIAFVAAAVYAAGASAAPMLRRNWIAAGLLYGAWVWLFMNLVVLPFSNVVPGPSGLPLFVNGIIGHAVFVGLPIAWFARCLGRERSACRRAVQ